MFGLYKSDKEQMIEAANQLRQAAQLLPCGRNRDERLRKADQLCVAAHLNDWMNSPGLQPPTKTDIPASKSDEI